MMKKIIQIFLAIFLAIPVFAQQTVSLENVQSVPGMVEVDLNMNGFTEVGAITIYIEYDPQVLDFQVPSVNPVFAGADIFLNDHENYLSLTWFSMSGPSIDGLLCTLDFYYIGGYTSDLTFGSNCEIADTAAVTIEGITYLNGSVSPDPTQNVGDLIIGEVFTAGADSVLLPDPPGGYYYILDPVEVPVVADGLSAAGIGSIQLAITFDNQRLTYDGYEPVQFDGWVESYNQEEGTLSFIKTSSTAMNIADGELLKIKFNFLNGLANVNFVAGTSLQYLNAVPVPVGMTDGYVNSVTQANLKVFLEGLYNSGVMNKAQDHDGVSAFDKFAGTIADQITVELRDKTDYSVVVWSDNEVDLNTDGTAVIYVPSMYNDEYYITVKHRNHLETVSMNTVQFGGVVNYDFTTGAGQAYGNNQKDLGDGNFAIFAGDINQDGQVTGSDRSLVNTDVIDIAKGYLTTDINGDGSVSGVDRSLVNTNVIDIRAKVIP